MKLYLVDYLSYHNDEGAELVVAADKKSAEYKVAKRFDFQLYSCYAAEVTSVDGYKVSITKE